MFTLTLETDNAAFGENAREEIKRILQTVIEQLNDPMTYGAVFDVNGNKVGQWHLAE